MIKIPNKTPTYLDVVKIAMDEVILKQGDNPIFKEAIKQLDDVAKITGKSIYELMEQVIKKKQPSIQDEFDEILSDRGL
jgi:hypothetical protein|tara:strand:- start:447 stop:683 length:237 start_codon:yes stop_codon:yes gene_type:complete